MLFYGHSSRVNFSTQLEAVTAYLALHFIMIHLIKVIKLTWMRCCSSAYCVTFIHCKRTWKWHLKENEALTWHITTRPSKLVDYNLYLHTPPRKDRTVSFIFFFRWERFLKSISRIVLWFPQKLKTPSSCSYNVAVCLMGQNGWVSEHKLRMTRNLRQLLIRLIVKCLSGGSMCRGEISLKISMAHFCLAVFLLFCCLYNVGTADTKTDIYYWKTPLNNTKSPQPC